MDMHETPVYRHLNGLLSQVPPVDYAFAYAEMQRLWGEQEFAADVHPQAGLWNIH